MTKKNLQIAIENEAEALRASAKKQAHEVREQAAKAVEKILAKGEEEVLQMTAEACKGVLRPWRCIVGAHNGGGGHREGWKDLQEILLIASSEEEAISKARCRASPMYYSGLAHCETAVPVWD